MSGGGGGGGGGGGSNGGNNYDNNGNGQRDGPNRNNNNNNNNNNRNKGVSYCFLLSFLSPALIPSLLPLSLLLALRYCFHLISEYTFYWFVSPSDSSFPLLIHIEGGKRQQDEEPHPDEELMFGKDALNKEGAFKYVMHCLLPLPPVIPSPTPPTLSPLLFHLILSYLILSSP